MQEIFTALNHALTGAPAVALLAAAIWGVLSILLSPCHLASIPLVVAVVGGQERTDRWRALSVSATFSAGILLTVLLVGGLTALAGRMLGDLGGWTTYAVAAVFILMGLYLLGVIPLDWQCALPGSGRKGLLAALVIGLIFGLAVGPCTFAYMAPMLGLTLKLASTQFLLAVLLLLAFAIGHCGVILLAGVSAGIVQSYLTWMDGRNGTVLRSATGALVLLAGLAILWAA